MSTTPPRRTDLQSLTRNYTGLPRPDVTELGPEEQRRFAEIEAARLAELFTESRGERMTGQPATAETRPLDAGSAQNMQDRKLAFVDAEADRRTVSPDRAQEKASPYVVQAGTVIPAALITGIR